MAMDTQSRRHFLKVATALGTLGVAAPLATQLAGMNVAAAQTATDYRALVCIFLFGGNDAHNTVLATDTDSWARYMSARNTGADPIALLPPGAAPTTTNMRVPGGWGGVLPIVPNTPNPVPAGTNATTRTFALHPMLAPLMPIWNAQRLAVVANAGPLIQPTTKAQFRARSVPLPSNIGSHNDQQATWMAGEPEGARRGWGGKIADQMLSSNGQNAVFTAVSPAGNTVFLAGNQIVQYQVANTMSPAIRIGSAYTPTFGASAAFSTAVRDTIRDNAGPSFFGIDHSTVVRRSMDSADLLNQSFTGAAVTGVPAPPPYVNPINGNTEGNGLATQLQTIARMIAAAPALGIRRQVFFASIGGWDTHDTQNTSQTPLLARVAHAMAYFDAVMGNVGGADMRNRVTTFTMSDFSRTFTTNGDGTDHAWGGHYFVMGGAVRGRDMYGQYPTIGVDQGTFNNPDQQGNNTIPTTSVDQYGATLGRWFGLGDTELATVFRNLGNYNTRTLGFL
jgi:uncharacterized protein (DUF1501 family)